MLDKAQDLEYPATFHFRVITEPTAFVEAEVSALLEEFKVVAALTPSRGSSGGRYRAYSVSIEMRSREELHRFDVLLKKVRGVRMVL
jgi:putative lipoic acid-binding regulatory protein